MHDRLFDLPIKKRKNGELLATLVSLTISISFITAASS